jgi:hypothetical protein
LFNNSMTFCALPFGRVTEDCIRDSRIALCPALARVPNKWQLFSAREGIVQVDLVGHTN